MASGSTISISYRIQGEGGGFKELTVDAEGCRKIMNGAQQVMTFLKEKTSLDVLLPVMNNLLAQQKVWALLRTTSSAPQTLTRFLHPKNL